MRILDSGSVGGLYEQRDHILEVVVFARPL